MGLWTKLKRTRKLGTLTKKIKAYDISTSCIGNMLDGGLMNMFSRSDALHADILSYIENDPYIDVVLKAANKDSQFALELYKSLTSWGIQESGLVWHGPFHLPLMAIGTPDGLTVSLATLNEHEVLADAYNAIGAIMLRTYR